MTARDRRAILFGAAIVLGALLAVRALPGTVRGLVALREHGQDRHAALAHAREVIARTSIVRDSLALAVAEVLRLAPSLVDGGSRAEAAATLTALISLNATRNRLKILRVAPSGDSATGILQSVRAVAELEGDIEGLMRFLAAVERGNPLLSVVSLAVTAPEVSPRPNAPEALRIELEVQGWFLARAEP